jgi:hypothetical protein
VAIEEPSRLGSAQLTGIQFGPSKIELRLFDLQDDVSYNETTRVAQYTVFPGTQLEQKGQLTLNKEKYWEIENTPTWPLDTQTRCRFTVNNLALFSPFVLDFISSSGPWRKLLDMLVNFLTDEG